MSGAGFVYSCPVNRRLTSVLALALGAAGLTTVTSMPAQAATRVPPPMKIVSATAPGPSVGSVTVSWKRVRSRWTPRTTGFRIETATTQFSPYHTSLPLHGKHAHVFTVAASARQLVIPAATMAKIGAPLASGNHLYVRVWSLDAKPGRPVRTYSDGRLHAVFPRGMASTGSGASVTMADWNVRIAGADSGTSHDWYRIRKPLVAQNLVDQAPGIITVQEANPTSYTGSAPSYRNPADHTNTQLLTLLGQLNKDSSGAYRLVRSTYYADYMDPSNGATQQGERIIYDSSRYTLLSDCPDMTARLYYNTSCSVPLPTSTPGDPVHANNKRWAGYAEFQVKQTGQRFWVVSVHLDNVGGGNDPAATQRGGDDLRQAQVQAVLDRIASLNTAHEPVLLAGDLNTFENSKSPHGYAAHDLLVRRGFYDTFAAAARSGYQYDTVNDYGLNARPDISGVGARIDTIMTQGIAGADSWRHVRFNPGGVWPSDHDMIVATFKLP